MSAERERNISKRPGVWSAWIGHVASGIALLALVFSLFGYGVITALTTRFGHNPGAVSEGPFDLLMICWVGVFVVIETLGSTDLVRVFGFVFLQFLWPCLIMTLIIFAWFIFRRYDSVIAHWRRSKLRELKSRISKGWRKRALYGFAMVAIWIAPFVVAIAGWVVIVIAIVVTGWLPSLGVIMGNIYADKHIISPEFCAPVRNRRQLMENIPVEGASCVRVRASDAGKNFDRLGRLVLSTSNYVIIFDPGNGEAPRIPVHDMIVEPVAQLEVEKRE